ncbi:MAG: chitooligosaccharide deacetylase [Candidatus Margulisiibacteriota bacterium]|nr:MAG: chitooligosaccharide deacetylase [Candidatus Margulisiibacteriota bacterium]HCY37486.1 chitooligosaccharide deacetylase [Candidatus Margulisiibacteriota bacterium]
MKKYIVWGILIVLISCLGGLGGSLLSDKLQLSNKSRPKVHGKLDNFYLKPSDNHWTSYVDNNLPYIIQHGDLNKRNIAITFDDGPQYDSTEAILTILRDFQIKATFFVVGSQAEKYPYLLKQMFDDGHEIGNHTFSHQRLTDLSREKAIQELENTRTVIFNQTGFIPYLFRPPGGKFDAETIEIAKELNYTTVLWTNNSGDWQALSSNKLSKRVIDNTFPGTIILMHNSDSSSTLSALPTIIRTLKRRGFAFVTVSQLYSQQNNKSQPVMRTRTSDYSSARRPMNNI